MKSRENIFKLSLIVICILFFQQSFAKENEHIKSLNANFKVDFFSIHTWRGSAVKSPCIEPSFEITKNNSTTGIWAAQSLDGNYTELDLYFKYSLKDFSFTVYDYFCPPSYKNSGEIIDFDRKTTSHIIEIDFAFNGTPSFPISLMAATMVYGSDRDANNQNMYSTYFEAGYSTSLYKNNVGIALGVSPFKSSYSKNFGFVNASLNVTRKVTIKKKEIPLYASLVTNPYAKNIFFKVGFTL
ncbi:MAG: hypothetical protein MI739_09205 [Bacteroidales bacterium]|nr:hypothetical protein [Bacteroidales bacterium]